MDISEQLNALAELKRSMARLGPAVGGFGFGIREPRGARGKRQQRSHAKPRLKLRLRQPKLHLTRVETAQQRIETLAETGSWEEVFGFLSLVFQSCRLC